MITVTNATKTAWLSEIEERNYKIVVDGATIYNDSISNDSFSFSDSIISSDSLEFVGCIAKKIEFNTSYFNSTNLKGKSISLYLRAGDTEWIEIFTGRIDQARKEGFKGLKNVVAYDVFYRLSQVDVSTWYNSLNQMNLSTALMYFCIYFNVPYNSSKLSLVNDITVYGGTYRQVKKLSGLDFLKQVCQINGCVGYTDGEGRFCIKYIDALTQNKLYPASSLFPSDSIYPSNTDSSGISESTTIPYYKSLDYEDYSIKQIDKVTIRNTSEDVGVYYPYAGDNNYIIQGNIFAFDRSSAELLEMAENIYEVVKDANFRPFSGEQMAFPWIECGDKVTYYDMDDEGNNVDITFIVMSRTLRGGMMLWDNFEAEGEQDQRIFITDLKAQLEDLQNQITENEEETESGSLNGVVSLEYALAVEQPVYGGYESAISGVVTEV